MSNCRLWPRSLSHSLVPGLLVCLFVSFGAVQCAVPVGLGARIRAARS